MTDIDCGLLPEIANGVVRYTNSTASTASLTYLGSEAYYECNTNYRLEGILGGTLNINIKITTNLISFY